ncbi:hypothetical protein HCJ93_24715 [Streptomyces sp. SBST2-5]|uniref:Uncharacterized protein n=1 Tax=Streptomyces composti TaxID=2720025 RepID=A0ABX1ACM4_9ACTN|nr:hypothetical protein [Streptomyces composti]NJP53181.1 hypothetical protein [Streptomyces composti]
MPDMSASASLALTHLVPLAKEIDKDKVTPGVLGFIVFAVMALAVWGLMKSMNRHMNRVDFLEAPAPIAPEAGEDGGKAADDTKATVSGTGGAGGAGDTADSAKKQD